MKTVFELLHTCPDNQVIRLQNAFREATAGNWQEVTHYLENAAREESGSGWGNECQKLANHYAVK